MQKNKIASIAFILYWVMFGVYYTSGIAFSSFWQIWCKLGINISLLLISTYVFSSSFGLFNRFISMSAIAFFAGMSFFYIVSFLLFDFFQLAVNDYVGYCFLGLIAISLSTSSIIIYGRKKQH